MDFDDKSGEIADTYKFLAEMFMRPPDVEMVEHFQDIFQTDLDESIHDIVDDFANLFFNPQEHLLPHESAYVDLDDTLLISDDVPGTVYDSYLKEGLVLEDASTAPDHISTELFFLSYLVESAKTDALKAFLLKHAVRWIPQFCDDLYDSASTEFYRELAAITKDFLLADYEELMDGE